VVASKFGIKEIKMSTSESRAAKRKANEGKHKKNRAVVKRIIEKKASYTAERKAYIKRQADKANWKSLL